MVLGFFFILSDRNRSFGILLIILGGVFYFNKVLHLNLDFWQIFFPGILILIGVMIILRHYVDRDGERGTSVRDDNFLDELAIFGGGDRVVTSKEFRGGKVTTVFGGLNYDMIQAKLAPGKNYIDVFCIFGGMKIIAPGDWDIKIKVFSIFGGFGEKQRYFRERAARENESQLIIKGTVIFGGGEIKRFHD
jgi:predicted membrane protein